MYLKRVVTRKPGGREYAYLKLVEAFRQGGRARERVLLTLGREDALKASGQLDALAAAFARRDPPTSGIRREVGPLLVVRHYLERLGLRGIVERALPERRRAQLTTAEVTLALIANRLSAPAPLYDVAGWASSAALQELFGIPAMLLNDDRLGRALEAFAPQAEDIRGAAALAAIERFGLEAARLHFDLTALRVCGAYERSTLVARGWSADRRVSRQVQVLQAATAAGIALYVRPEPGNAAELSVVGAALEHLAQLLPPGLLVCADSALGYPKTLCAAERAGLRFVVPLRADSGFRERFQKDVGHRSLRSIAYVARRERDLAQSERTRYRGALREWTVSDRETGTQRRFRVAYIWSSEEEASVRAARERALAAAEESLARVRRGLGTTYKSAKAVRQRVAKILGPAVQDLLTVTVGERKGRPTLRVARDRAAIARAKKLDGVYALATNLPGRLSPTRILRTYKDQSLVELRHRDLKGSLRVRPLFLHNDDRIRALISIVGLALLVFGLIEHDLRRRLGSEELFPGLLPEGRAARPTGRNILAAFQGLGLTYSAEGIRLDRLTATQRRILRVLDIVPPWPELSAA